MLGLASPLVAVGDLPAPILALTPGAQHAAFGGAFALLGLGLAAVLAVGAATRPGHPRPAEATMDLGDEPPAIVDLVTDDFEVTSEAVPATLLDLAARHWFDIEEVAEGQTICRLRAQGHGDLLPYEQRVLDHLRALAANGVVPAEALTTGPEAASKAWWRSFRREVTADAQQRGLCQRRWPRVVEILLWIAALGAGGLLWLARSGEATHDANVRSAVTVIGILLLFWVAGTISASDRQRDTPEGLRVAARWLGVRRYLADHGDFPSQPPAAVQVWDRYLAYAAAMDLATLAVSQLPLGAEEDRHAWSSVNGQWRQVTVHYPRYRPGWGRHPVAATLLGLIGMAVSLGLGWLCLQVSHDPTFGGNLDTTPRYLTHLGSIALVVALAFLLPAAYGLVELVRGVLDLFSDRSVTGVVLRQRERHAGLQAPKIVRYFTDPARRGSKEREPRWYLAVDDGAFDRVDAWRVRRQIYLTVRQHQRVRADVTARCGYVRHMETEGLTAGAAPAEVLDNDAATMLLAAAEALTRSHPRE